MQPSWWPAGVTYPLPPQDDPSWGGPKNWASLVKYAQAKKKVDDAKKRFDMLQSAVQVVRNVAPRPNDAAKPQDAAEAMTPIAIPSPAAPSQGQPSWSPPVSTAQPFVPTLPVAQAPSMQMPTLFIQGDDTADPSEDGIGGGSAVSPLLIGAGALALLFFLGRK